jgi:PIN domain nuclease of toxin-antitoxin system
VILLLDAHALVWWLNDDPALTRQARGAIADPANDVLVSAATVWELAIKRANGKIDLAADLVAAIEDAGFVGLPVTLSDAQAAGELPLHHRDPFDRMLVAQARRLEAVIVSRDRALGPYDVPVLGA